MLPEEQLLIVLSSKTVTVFILFNSIVSFHFIFFPLISFIFLSFHFLPFHFISGKNRQVRLYPLSSLDGHDTEPVKIVETKGIVSSDTFVHVLSCSMNHSYNKYKASESQAEII